ncbi:hypothetical protein I546_1231 [Mycobacterium kansasii 732]|nr:hypothetical protein I546_1231 [Mycobacterium kansasii 732]
MVRQRLLLEHTVNADDPQHIRCATQGACQEASRQLEFNFQAISRSPG